MYPPHIDTAKYIALTMKLNMAGAFVNHVSLANFLRKKTGNTFLFYFRGSVALHTRGNRRCSRIKCIVRGSRQPDTLAANVITGSFRFDLKISIDPELEQFPVPICTLFTCCVLGGAPCILIRTRISIDWNSGSNSAQIFLSLDVN